MGRIKPEITLTKLIMSALELAKFVNWKINFKKDQNEKCTWLIVKDKNKKLKLLLRLDLENEVFK